MTLSEFILYPLRHRMVPEVIAIRADGTYVYLGAMLEQARCLALPKPKRTRTKK